MSEDIARDLKVVRENCPHYSYKDVTPWHGDVFDHPSYQSYCSKDGKDKPIYLIHCVRCSFFKTFINNERK